VRVGVNLLWCRTGRVGGSEEYLVRQLVGLAQCGAPDVEVALFAQPSLLAAHPDLSVGAAHASPEWGDARWRRIVGEHRWLPRAARGLDAMHHGGGTLPRRGQAATLLTVHDVQYLTYPRWFGATKLAYLRATVPSSVRRASRVAVPSAYVRDVIVERFGRDPREVHVVRHGLEPSLGAAPTPDPELRRRYGLGDGPYLVYPAITHPHKNHEFLCDLLAGPLRDADVQVVCAGGEGRAHDALRRRIAETNLHDRMKLVGRLNDADRDGLLAMSAALVFPSSYEGFGAPVIEAMALGTPVIASDRTALPEVVGDAGQVVTLDVEAWAAAIEHAVRNRDEWARRGASRAGQFRSVDSGRDLAVAYRRTMEQPR